MTLVGNDSGGAYSQIGVAARPERIGRLVLASLRNAGRRVSAAAVHRAAAGRQRRSSFSRARCKACAAVSARLRPEAFGLLAKHPIPDDVFDSYALPVVEDDRILHDIAKAMRSASETHVRHAADTLIANFRKPVLMAWAAEDPVFPLAHAQAYAARLSNARVETIADAYSFTAEDQPERLAELIAAFVAEHERRRRERDGAPAPRRAAALAAVRGRRRNARVPPIRSGPLTSCACMPSATAAATSTAWSRLWRRNIA